MRVTPDDLIATFKSFYSRDGNRIDLDVTKRRIESMTDRGWRSLIYGNPVHFLTTHAGSSRFFSLDGDDLVLSGDLADLVRLPVFRRHVEDAVAYRVMDFKRSRYERNRRSEE